MLSTAKSFLRNGRGSVMTMSALTLPIIVAAVGFSIDYTNAIKKKNYVQKISDAAALIAARRYQETDDKEGAVQAAQNYFDSMMERPDLMAVTNEFQLSTPDGTKDILAANEVDVTFRGYFSGLVELSHLKAKLNSTAKLTELPQDLYLVLLVDSTASMNSLIESVKEAVVNLEQEVRDALLANGLDVGKIYVKIAFFGDLRLDPSPEAWTESDVYNLGIPEETTALRDFVSVQPTYYGYDTPESSPAAIAHFLTAPLPSELDPDLTVQATVLWTDAPGLPLDDLARVDDITVNLYKAFGEIGDGSTSSHMDDTEYWDYNSIPDLEYTEADKHDGDATGTETTPPSYGCCSSMTVFEDRWRKYGSVALDRRMLGLIVPTSEKPWTVMATWPNVTVKDYTSPTATGILDDVIDSLSSRYSPLYLSQ